MRCYVALKKSGELKTFPKTRFGTPEELNPLPIREPWTWTGDEVALAAMTERAEAEKAQKAAQALDELKQ